MYDLTFRIQYIAMLNTPRRVRQGVTILPWEVLLFKTLADASQQINIHDLITAYTVFMHSHGLTPQAHYILFNDLQELYTYQVGTDAISYRSYTESLKWIIDKKRLSVPVPLTERTLDKRKFNKINWLKHGMLLLTFSIDILSVGLLILSNPAFPIWLLIARCSAVCILTNIAYILIPFTGVVAFVPDTILAVTLPINYSSVYHAVFGIKVLVSALIHTAAHLLHIRYSIKLCANGCSRESIHIVPTSKSIIVISYSYFFSQFAYITGVALIVIFICLTLLVVSNKLQLIRYSTNQLLHKYATILGIVLTIIHGMDHLVGFNYSYALTLPFLAAYLWNHRYELLPQYAQINRWVVTSSMIRLYLNDNKRFDTMLKSFGTVTVYVNYPSISRLEWHPFTLTRGPKEATLSMQRVGTWTNRLGNLLQSQVHVNHSIRIGHYKLSKFRFHHLYRIRYFFCAGIGITAFLSAIADTVTRRNRNYTSVLIWSVSSIEIVKEFIRHLNDLTKQISNLKIEIYYSNSRNGAIHVPEHTKTRFLYLQSIIHGYSGVDVVLGVPSCVCCIFSRADFMQLLLRAILSWKNEKCIGIFICGSKRYTNNVVKYAELANANKYGLALHSWSESA